MGEKDHLKIKIGNRLIGSGEPAYLIAEMSANHAGSIERAKEIIHAAKESGADCIKIQTYTPDTLTIDCHNKYFQVNNGTWEGENLYSASFQSSSLSISCTSVSGSSMGTVFSMIRFCCARKDDTRRQ